MALTTVPVSLSATALTLTTAAQPNITSVGTLTGLTVSGNIAGTLTTAAQTNITSLGTLSALTISGDLTVDTSTLKVDSSNNRVGIGEASPGFPLHVNSSGTDIAKFESSGSYTFTRFSSSSRNWALSMGSSFSVYDETASQTRLIIDSSGNVGIGDSTPQALLDVGGGYGGNTTVATFAHATDAYIEIENMTTQNGAGIILSNAGTKKWTIQKDTSAHGLYIQDASANENMTFLQGGNVGIGTSNPASLLHIEGNTNGYNTAPLIYFGSTSTANAAVRDWAIGPADSDYGNFHIFQGASTGAAAVGTAQIAFTIDSNKNVRTSGKLGIGMDAAQALDIERTSGLSLRFYNGGSFKAGLQVPDSSGQMIGTSAANDFAIRSQSNLLFASGGNTERLRIASSGNVVIVDTSLEFDKPSVYGFRFLHNDSGNDLSIQQGDANNANYVSRLTIDSGGRVGIGTTNPGTYYMDKLVVVAPDESGITIAGTGANQRQMIGFADGTSGDARYAGYIGYDHNNDTMSFNGGGAGAARLTILSNGNIVKGNASSTQFVDYVHRKTYSINRVYTHIANINSTNLGCSYEVHIKGTTSSVVVNAHFHIMVGHYFDIAIKSFGNAYTACKVKVVTNGNEDSSLYIGAATSNNNTFTGTVSIRVHDNATVNMAPSSAYNTCYLEHAQSATSSQETTTGSATSGSGPTNAYTV